MQTTTRTKVSNEQINHAIEQLNAEGTKPTIRAVRERLGAGSPNRIQPLLAIWNDSNKPAEAATATLSDSAQQTLADLLARERSAAVAAKLEEIAELKSELQEVTQTGQQLEDDNERLDAANAQLDEQRSEAVTLAAARQQRVEQLEAEQARLQSRLDEQVQTIATVSADNAALQRETAQQQQRIDQQAAALDAAREQAAAAQQAAAVAEAKQVAAAAALDTATATATTTAAATAKRIERLEQQLEQAQKRLDDAQAQRSADAQTHVKALAQRDEQLATEHKKNAELMTKLDELSDKLKAAEAKQNQKKEA